MNPDTLSTLAAIITDQAVSSARARTITAGVDGSAHAEMSAGDGSRWWIVVAPYGAAYGWADTDEEAVRDCANKLAATTDRLLFPDRV